MAKQEIKNSSLEKLFPDKGVRAVINKVISNSGSKSAGQSTSYKLLDKNKKVVKEAKGAACFADLPRFCKTDKETIKYLQYLVSPSELLSEQIKNRWIALCQELEVVPSHQTSSEILGEGILLDLRDPELKVHHLYMYLCLIRWLREAPALVENVIQLVDDAGRDFWASISFCHKQNIANAGHSILPYSGIYATGPYTNSSASDAAFPLKLHFLVRNIDNDFEHRSADELFGEWAGWLFHSEVVKPPASFVLEEREMLLSGELMPFFGAKAFKEAKDIAEEINKRGTNVRFKSISCE